MTKSDLETHAFVMGRASSLIENRSREMIGTSYKINSLLALAVRDISKAYTQIAEEMK